MEDVECDDATFERQKRTVRFGTGWAQQPQYVQVQACIMNACSWQLGTSLAVNVFHVVGMRTEHCSQRLKLKQASRSDLPTARLTYKVLASSSSSAIPWGGFAGRRLVVPTLRLETAVSSLNIH